MRVSPILAALSVGGPHYCIKAKDISCYACNKPGDVARNCKSAGNGKRALGAPRVTRKDRPRNHSTSEYSGGRTASWCSNR